MAITAVQNILFDVDCESTNFGKLVLVDQSDYVGEGIDPANVSSVFTVTYPDGDSAIVNVSPSVSTTGLTDIPLDSNGDYMQGTYTFNLVITVGGAVQPGAYSQTIVYDFCPEIELTPGSCSLPNIGFISDCFCLKITATDATIYGTPTNISRTITLFPPPSLALPSVSTSAATLIYPFSYTGGYEIEINTSLGYLNTAGNVGIAARVKGSCYEEVKCDVNLCSLYNCMKKMFASLERKAGLLGGKSKLPLELQDTWDTLIELDMLFAHALQCGQYADAQTYYDRIEALVDCDCGCQEGTGPQLVNPYCGGGAGSGITTVVTGTGNIDVTAVTVGTTITYTVAMTSGFVASITAIQNAITTIQGQITTINNTIAALPPKQYYLLYDNLDVSETGANTTLTALKTYVLPADTLEEGDILRITSCYTLFPNNNDKVLQLNYGVQASQLILTGVNANPGSAQRVITFTTEIYKNSPTQVLQVQKIENGTSLPATVPFSRRIYTADANIGATVSIVANGQNGTASAGDITCISLTVELIKAP